MRPRLAVLCGSLLAAALLCPAEGALAAWSLGTSGAGGAKARTMPTGGQPSASAANRSVTVSWPQSAFPAGPAVNGYVVSRYSPGGQSQAVGAGCSGVVSGLSCTETAVPAGDWLYAVTPRQGGWSGPEGPRSTAVTVAAPSFSLDSTTVASLPATRSGTLSGFLPGQTVTFRLDDAATGTVLAGSVTPTPIAASGAASVGVTIPAGTSNGTHTVYAVGSGGDTASLAITVAAPSGPGFVRSVGQATCGATGMSIPVPAAGVAAGDTVIVRLALRGTSSGAVAASDTRGNAYVADRNVLNGNQRLTVLRAFVTGALVQGNAINVTYPAATGAVVVADELSGVAANPVDASAGTSGNSAAPSVAVTATAGSRLLVGAVSLGALASFTQPLSWTGLGSQSVSCGATIAAGGGYRALSSAGTYTYNPTVTASGRWAAAAVAYRGG